MTKHEISYGKHQISYTLKRKDVKNINLNLKPNLTVEISASHNVPIKTIHSFVRKKANWIIRNKEYFMQAFPGVKYGREYVNGETFRYLGRQYRLKVIKRKTESVKCKRGFFYLYVEDKQDYQRKEKLLKDWYQKNSARVFNESLEKMYSILKKYNIPMPKLTIRHMKARWGSCVESKSTILINSDLIEAPKFCIDYVILHELIHFKYKNHDKNFYKLQESIMPDWGKRKNILDTEVVRSL
jgi:predicted metal-dependent hydrolase